MRLMISLIASLVPSLAHADERFLPYIDWIADRSGYEYNGEPLPTIEYHSPAMLAILIHGEQYVAEAELNGWNVPEIWGAYNHDTNVMLLPTDASWDDDQTIVTIVHELVHFMQTINGAMPECGGLSEEEAYRLHWRYTQEHELDVEEPNWLFVALVGASCFQQHW